MNQQSLTHTFDFDDQEIILIHELQRRAYENVLERYQHQQKILENSNSYAHNYEDIKDNLERFRKDSQSLKFLSNHIKKQTSITRAVIFWLLAEANKDNTYNALFEKLYKTYSSVGRV